MASSHFSSIPEPLGLGTHLQSPRLWVLGLESLKLIPQKAILQFLPQSRLHDYLNVAEEQVQAPV